MTRTPRSCKSTYSEANESYTDASTSSVNVTTKKRGCNPKKVTTPSASTSKSESQKLTPRQKYKQKNLEAVKEYDKEYSRKYRQNLSEEQKAKSREATARRMREYRARKKNANVSPKKRTRKVTMDVAKQRELWRESKKKERAKWTKQKQRRIKEKDRNQKKRRKEQQNEKKREMAATIERMISGKKKKQSQESVPETPKTFVKNVDKYIDTATPRKRAVLDQQLMFKMSTRRSQNAMATVAKAAVESSECRSAIVKSARKLAQVNRSALSKGLGMSRKVLAYKPKIAAQRKNDVQKYKKLVEDFFYSPQYSIQLPLKKHVKKETTTFVLREPIRALHKTFTETHLIPIGLISFLQMKPANVRPQRFAKWNQCLCEYCENVQLKLRALRGVLIAAKTPIPDELLSIYKLSEATMCNPEEIKCIRRQCSNCAKDVCTIPAVNQLRGENIKIRWFQWEFVEQEYKGKCKKKLAKTVKCHSFQRFCEVLNAELVKFPQHLFTANWQHNQYTKLINDMDHTSAAMVVDFAENYVHAAQDEPQSHHWGQESTTIHPAVATCKTAEGSVFRYAIDIISDDRKHDSFASTLFIEEAIKLLLIKLPHIKFVHIFSDGCAGQYKGKTAFFHLSRLRSLLGSPLEVMWSFFGSRHGKGPSDGESAVIKSAVTRAVMAGASIADSREFHQYCMTRMEKHSPTFRRTVLFVSKTRVEERRSEDIPTLAVIPGTRDLHCVMPTGMDGLVVTKTLSCFCEKCLARDPRHCVKREATGVWTERSVIARGELCNICYESVILLIVITLFNFF